MIPPAAQASSTFVNPVFNVDFPDPDVLKVGNTYYGYATNGNGFNIQVARSTDLVHWQGLNEALPRVPKWAVQQFGFSWAPEVKIVGDDSASAPLFLYRRLNLIRLNWANGLPVVAPFSRAPQPRPLDSADFF